MENKIKYVCTGGCGGSVTEEEYNSDNTVCGTLTCPKHGQPFEKKIYCVVCGQELTAGEVHQH